ISDIIPDDFSLSQNYPNPFNPFTKLGFKIPDAGNLKLQVFDVSGKLVSILANERLSHGEYSYNFRGENLPSGTYFYKLDFNSNYRSTGKILKMTLVK
ncbi:MAG: T9SS type A sorting domain-containing protein, partial [Ignavibacteriae bacterium]|nr:T9SS type A sorting domain-containing protein [Ignavibacteriota bacterium]